MRFLYILILCLSVQNLLAQTPVLVKDINPGSTSSVYNNFSKSYQVNASGILYFIANESATGIELWRSDGTENGTYLVKDINPGSGGSYPSSLVNVNGIVYFAADDGTHGYELWRSNGTDNGTYIVKDLNPGIYNSIYPTYFYLTNVNGILYFIADDGTTNGELFRSDGTESGTRLVKEFAPGGGASGIHDIATANGILYFVVSSSGIGEDTGAELWGIDSSTGDPYLIKDIWPRNYGSDPQKLTDINGILYFMANDGTHGYELWRSNGTADGTYLVRDFTPDTVPGSLGTDPSRLTELTNVDGILYFVFDDEGSTGKELWRSDGTSAGTYLVKDIYSGSMSADPQHLTSVNGLLFFAANDGSLGKELWRSDGTATGTYLVKDIFLGINSSDLHNFCNVNGTLYFSARDEMNGYELWRSNGTLNGTSLVYNISPGGDSSDPFNLINVNGTLFFGAYEYIHGQELWRLDPQFPNLTPILYARPSTVRSTTSISIVVDVSEVNDVPTTEIITVKITKDPKATLTWITDATTVGEHPVLNSAWHFDDSDADYYILTTTQSIEAGNQLSFGLTGQLAPGATTGTLTISAVLVGGSGGETRFGNNVDADKIDYFQ